MLKRSFTLRARGGTFLPRQTMTRTRAISMASFPGQKQNTKLTSWLIGISGFGALSLGIFYFYWPRHNFPSPVAKKLRQALWEESEKSDHDYQGALRYYLEALQECDNSGVSSISDEYTGVELKIAEMYERLGMQKEAHNVYIELLYRYYDALQDTNSVPNNLRPHLIQKDLRVLIKSIEMNQDVELGKRNLLTHLLMAQEEVLSRSPELKKFFDRRKQRTLKLFQGKATGVEPIDFQALVNENTIKLDEDSHMILDLAKDSSAWEPFKDEFFTARDLYTAYCLSTKDIASALSCKLTTVEWMVMADMPPGQILLSQANLGSLLYLQAETFESQIYRLNQKREEEPGLKTDDNIIKTLRTLHRNRDSCFDMATKCYDSVIKFSKRNNKLRFNAKDLMDHSAAHAIALSTYGMGVINLHNGTLPRAERLLKDSISMAQETDFQELYKEANQELKKVYLAKETTAKTSKTDEGATK
ncbi:LAMI_0G05050g1_1 [Lachancea mirantina]|uniref:LAMI_0G05050g1_1 n=1 Tax=Lachancea mirantina TaxID=1230905 RepID=A0A1G4K8P9_9SACH|nr:LAMI_0G05050g1_1 [Lachancea mirantina]